MNESESTILIKEVSSVNVHNEAINQISIFPSGNIISVSNDCSIKIWDKNLNIIQIIILDKIVLCVSIKNENTFSICSNEIQIWQKRNMKQFKCIEKIKDIQNGFINFILYCPNNDIIVCSCHFWITIYSFTKKTNIHQSSTTLIQKSIDSLLYLGKEKYLICAGREGLSFLNYITFEKIKFLKDAKCFGNNSLCRLNKDEILCGGTIDCVIKVISISEKKIIHKINNQFFCYGLCALNHKNIFFCCGESNVIKIYNCDNYQLVGKINNTHYEKIKGLYRIDENLICSIYFDKVMKIFQIIQ